MMYSLSAEMVAIVVCLAAWEGLVWSAPLQQYKERESTNGCPQPALLRHSSFECQLPPGSTFVAYCTFIFSPSGSRPSIIWFHDPQPTDNNTRLNGRTTTVSIKWENSSTGSMQSVTTNISIVNISSKTDQGVYIARVSSHCGATAECKISLSTLNRCYSVIPTVESTKYRRTLVVPESHQVSIQANYSGDTDRTHFDVQWQLKSNSDLVGTDKVGKFQSNRTLHGLCSFTEILTINNASHFDSGLYTAYVSPLQHTSHANITIDLQIIPWPTVTVWPGKSVQLNNRDKTPLNYHLTNFTKYISLFVVKDDAVINWTEDGMVIRHNPLEDTNITVNVMIPERASGQYKLCYEFTGNVSTSHNQPSTSKWCTENTIVTTELPKSKKSFQSMAIALGVAIGLSVIVFSACVVSICKLKLCRRESPSERDRLMDDHLQSEYGTCVSGQDTKAPVVTPPGNAPASDVTTDYAGRGPLHYESAVATAIRDTGRRITLWKQVPADIIDGPMAISIAQRVEHWEPLARHLGLQESEIVAIQENSKGNYEEQKCQMILRWRKRSGSRATLQELVRCVEEKLKDGELADRIAFINKI